MERSRPASSTQRTTFQPSSWAAWSAGAAGGQIAGIQLVDVRLGVGVALPLPEQGDGAVSGHIQVKDQIGTWKPHFVMLKIVQPAEKGLPLLGGALDRLVDGVRGGVAVGED